jgi:hypothetical protein
MLAGGKCRRSLSIFGTGNGIVTFTEIDLWLLPRWVILTKINTGSCSCLP